DWQAALVPLVVKRGWAGRPSPVRARTVFTIHNVAYQGVFPREAMVELDLPGDLFNADALEFYGKLNLMKAGLVFADKLTTVSPTRRAMTSWRSRRRAWCPAGCSSRCSAPATARSRRTSRRWR